MLTGAMVGDVMRSLIRGRTVGRTQARVIVAPQILFRPSRALDRGQPTIRPSCAFLALAGATDDGDPEPVLTNLGARQSSEADGRTFTEARANTCAKGHT